MPCRPLLKPAAPALRPSGPSAALARLQLDVVHHGTGWNVLERQRIADQNIRTWSGGDHAAYLEAHGANYIALFAIRIMKQRDPRRAVWIILDGRHFGDYIRFVALKIDGAVSLISAPPPIKPAGYASMGVAAPGSLFTLTSSTCEPSSPGNGPSSSVPSFAWLRAALASGTEPSARCSSLATRGASVPLRGPHPGRHERASRAAHRSSARGE